MCRWAAWTGAPIFLSDLVTAPAHSLIEQSRAADECKTATNADGFGVAWYGARPEPGLYRDVYPAWSDPNLRSLCGQVQSGLFMAHVRASTGTATSRDNCHPFVVGRWSFMHNGQIGGFEKIRKQVDMGISDELYPYRKGATDSEAMFLMALAGGLDDDPVGAMARAAGQLQRMSETHGAAPHLRLSVAFSDGKRLFVMRDASDRRAPTIYYRWCPARGGYMVVSEPLDADGPDWQALPSGTAAIFENGTVELQQIAPHKNIKNAA